MEFGENKTKIVWICHFAKKEISEILLKKNVIFEKKPINEFATWINCAINEFEKKNDIELHIISPLHRLKKDLSFKHKNIYYHLFNAGIPFLGRFWPRRYFPLDYWTNFYINKKKVKRVVDKINPDIIHLHGAENAYYSSAIFQFKNKYPIFITIQGYLFLTNYNQTYITKKRIEVEREIYSQFEYFNIRADFMEKPIKDINPNAKLYRFMYPIPDIHKILKLENQNKEYDFIYYGRVNKPKGIEDTLKAFKKVNAVYPETTLKIIGSWPGYEYKRYLDQICIDLNIKNKVSFLGYFPSLNDAHKIVIKGKILVSPTINDVIPGTIIECMFMKIPVIAYTSGGVPDINKTGEFIKLVQPDDIDGLAKEMILLLENENYRNSLSGKAFVRISEMFDNKKVYKNFIDCYNNVIYLNKNQ